MGSDSGSVPRSAGQRRDSESLKPVRCQQCGRSLPVLARLTAGSVLSVRCRDCKSVTVKAGTVPPHWA